MEITKFTPFQIPLEEVVKATNNFADKNIIGGGVSATIYKGQLLWSGKLMKISARRLNRKYGHGHVEFLTEISMLSDLQHENIVTFIGFCDEKGEKVIITSYEPNGSLQDHLSDLNLSWIQRLRICVGLARALRYLQHDEGRSYGVIHRNINSYSILLDENWEPKLSGFEISIKQLVGQENMTSIYEPIEIEGYMDPAIKKTGRLTYKSDVYSLGVVLFEILFGRKAVIPEGSDKFLAPLAKVHYENKTLLDIPHHNLWNMMNWESFHKFSYAAYSCLMEKPVQRPNIDEVVVKLEEALKLQIPQENLIKNLEHLKIPYNNIKLATDNFSKTYDIGFGGFYEMYRARVNHFDVKNPYAIEMKNKGELLERQDTVVIKRLKSRQHKRSFFREIETLSCCKHDNIITLLGFCVDGSELVLVIENYNGYLGFYMNKVGRMSVLSWTARLKICLDVAYGLNYLHVKMEDQKVIINRDIRSDYIALDENWGAKIGNFGVAVFLPPNQADKTLYLVVSGTKGYRDPEYEKTKKLKRESDVYSFGVVLFENFCGKYATNQIYKKDGDEGLAMAARRCFRNGTLKEMIDPTLKEEAEENHFLLNRGPNNYSLDTFLEIAYQCVEETQDRRPTMEVVIKQLKKALAFQENNNDCNLKLSLEDIKMATKNFHPDNCIGGGGFGKVFKGKVAHGDGFNTIVAKRLDTRHGQGEQHFRNELQILFHYKHENVVSLVGYCNEKDDKLIVYEYVDRGSLDRCLNDPRLTWMKRLKICIDVATALDFLHGGSGTQATVIHRDIKSANILLNNDWKAKIGDFGLSLISPINQETDFVIDHACGTEGYLDPLYKRSGFLTKESDIYSFGVVLFEILCGKLTYATYKHEHQFLPSFIKQRFEEGKHDEVVFEAIKEQINPKSLDTFVKIAFQCLHDDRDNRPTTKQVLAQLEMALEFQEEMGQLSKSGKQLFEEVLRKRNGHYRGRGQKLSGVKLTHPQPSTSGSGLQSQVDSLQKQLTQTQQEFAKKSSEHDLLKKKVEFLMKIQTSLNPHLFEEVLGKQLFKKVLEKRNGHYRGRGRKLLGVKLTHPQPSPCGSRLQSQVDSLQKQLTQTKQEFAKKSSEHDLLKKQVEILMKIQASQNPDLFQDPSLFQNQHSGPGKTSGLNVMMFDEDDEYDYEDDDEN